MKRGASQQGQGKYGIAQEKRGKPGGQKPDKGMPLPTAIIDAIACFRLDRAPEITLPYAVRDTIVNRRTFAHTLAAMGAEVQVCTSSNQAEGPGTRGLQTAH